MAASQESALQLVDKGHEEVSAPNCYRFFIGQLLRDSIVLQEAGECQQLWPVAAMVFALRETVCSECWVANL